MQGFIGLFTYYFLILMIIECLVPIFIDFYNFKKKKQADTARKARITGIAVLIISIVLFIVRSRS